MRILMLSHTYPPALGGIERHVRTLSIELVRRGHSVSVVTLGDGQLPALDDDEGVRIYRLRGSIHRLEKLLFVQAGRSYSPPFPDPEITWQLRAIVADEQPDIVHAHNWLVHAYLPLKRTNPARLVVTLHDYGMVCARWNLMQGEVPCSGPAPAKCLKCGIAHFGLAKGLPTVALGWATSRWEWGAVDHFVPVSRAVATGNQLDAQGAPYTVIPNFLGTVPADYVDDPRLAQLPAEPFILYVGAIARSKGVDLLLDAYQRVCAVRPAPPLVLIGYETGGYQLSGDALPPGVHLATNWPNTLVFAAWRRSLFGVVPSIWPEPCPTVAMEAMACGRPVVGARIGGLPDLIDDTQTGLLVAPGDAAALAQAISILASDPQLCARMGAAGQRKVDDFRATTVVGRVETLYSQLLRAPEAATPVEIRL